MNLNVKHKAFTLTETVFGLIISSVLIGVIYTVFTSFNKQFVMFQSQQLITNDYLVFDATLNKDLYDAVHVAYLDEILSLKLYDETTIRYSFKNGTIERKCNDHTETVFSTLASHTFQNEKNHSILSLKLLLHGESVVLNYYKKNTPEQLINSAFIATENRHKF